MYCKTVLVLLCINAFLGIGNGQDMGAALEQYENTPTQDGYSFSYKTSDGSAREENGVIMNPGTDNEELVVMGSYGYEDGNVRTETMYTADENGYRPQVSMKNKKLNPQLLASLAG